jgi:hypothetical protein
VAFSVGCERHQQRSRASRQCCDGLVVGGEVGGLLVGGEVGGVVGGVLVVGGVVGCCFATRRVIEVPFGTTLPGAGSMPTTVPGVVPPVAGT